MYKKYLKLKILFFSFLFGFFGSPVFAKWPDQGVITDGYHMMGTGMDWIMYLFWGIVLGILILVIYWILNLPQKDTRMIKTKNKASEILKKRFAKGEINIKEFKSLKKHIIAD